MMYFGLTMHTIPVVLRSANDADLTDILDVFQETILRTQHVDYSEKQLSAWASSVHDPERWKKRIQGQYFRVALYNEQIVGFASLENGAYIDLLYVHPDHQRQGIAQVLYTDLLKEANRMGATSIHTFASHTARLFFERQGFYHVRERTVTRNSVTLSNHLLVCPIRDPVVLETTRLTLEEATLQDGFFFQELLTNPTWIEHIGDRGIHERIDAEEYIYRSLITSYRKNGFGLYKMVLRESGEPIGICGLLQRPYLSDPDIGFATLPVHAGNGYTREAVIALLNREREQDPNKQIWASTSEANSRSRALLEKLGFVFSHIHTEDEPLRVYVHRPSSNPSHAL